MARSVLFVFLLFLSSCRTRAVILFPNATFLHLDGLEIMSTCSNCSQFAETRDYFLEKSSPISSIKNGFFVNRGRRKRQVIAGDWYKWRGTRIPYQIWGGDKNFQRFVRNGIRMWEADTCLRFIENAKSNDAIRYILERGDSCFTEYIGKTGGQQDIVIGSECAEGYVVAHETGHALGFWHTHQRPDREQHITINWKNVKDEATASFMPYRRMLRAFGIRDVSGTRVPYDYGSLMHYHAVAHAKHVSDFTIVPRDLKFVTTMGTELMSFLDAKVINDLYCSDSCSAFPRLQCHNGGYPNPNDCYRCKCPDGMGGINCELLAYSHCGGELVATGNWQVLKSPTGVQHLDCFWRIWSKRKVRFRLINGDFPCSYGCQSYVEIKHKLDFRLTGFRSCCYRPKEDVVSSGNQIFVIFHPNGRSAHFTLRYIVD